MEEDKIVLTTESYISEGGKVVGTQQKNGAKFIS